MIENYLEEEIERKRVLTEEILAQIDVWNNLMRERGLPLRVELNFLNAD